MHTYVNITVLSDILFSTQHNADSLSMMYASTFNTGLLASCMTYVCTVCTFNIVHYLYICTYVCTVFTFDSGLLFVCTVNTR